MVCWACPIVGPGSKPEGQGFVLWDKHFMDEGSAVVHGCLLTHFSEFQSIILPVHNAEQWLDECLMSVLQQDFEGTMELSVFNDASKVFTGQLLGDLILCRTHLRDVS